MNMPDTECMGRAREDATSRVAFSVQFGNRCLLWKRNLQRCGGAVISDTSTTSDKDGDNPQTAASYPR